ncbi:hypothetical protein D3C86_1788560 [compost metagenome]
MAEAMKVSDMAARAMLMPPEDDPVIPASKLMVMAWLTNGLGMTFSASTTATKPGNAAMTAPKPYSDAVLRVASIAPLTALRLPSASLRAMVR